MAQSTVPSNYGEVVTFEKPSVYNVATNHVVDDLYTLANNSTEPGIYTAPAASSTGVVYDTAADGNVPTTGNIVLGNPAAYETMAPAVDSEAPARVRGAAGTHANTVYNFSSDTPTSATLYDAAGAGSVAQPYYNTAAQQGGQPHYNTASATDAGCVYAEAEVAGHNGGVYSKKSSSGYLDGPTIQKIALEAAANANVDGNGKQQDNAAYYSMAATTPADDTPMYAVASNRPAPSSGAIALQLMNAWLSLDISGSRAEKALKKHGKGPGYFCMRKSKSAKDCIVLVVLGDARVEQYQFRRTNGRVSISPGRQGVEEPSFASFDDCMGHYLNAGIGTTGLAVITPALAVVPGMPWFCGGCCYMYKCCQIQARHRSRCVRSLTLGGVANPPQNATGKAHWLHQHTRGTAAVCTTRCVVCHDSAISAEQYLSPFCCVLFNQQPCSAPLLPVANSLSHPDLQAGNKLKLIWRCKRPNSPNYVFLFVCLVPSACVCFRGRATRAREASHLYKQDKPANIAMIFGSYAPIAQCSPNTGLKKEGHPLHLLFSLFSFLVLQQGKY